MGTNDGVKPNLTPAAKPDVKPDAKPTTAELLAQNATPEGRAKTAAMFGVKDQPDEIIDVYSGDPEGKTSWDDLVKAVGGPAQVKTAAQDFREAVALAGIDYDEESAGLTDAEENDMIVSELAAYRAALASPAKAAAILNALWADPDSKQMRAYIHGRDPNVTEAITKLMQAAHGEPVVGLQKPKGEGHSYQLI
jgi:hypothetical protein